jgi:hypothetical protein
MVNGQIRIQRYVVEEEKVKTWKLRPERIKELLRDKQAEYGTQGALQLVQEYLKENDWESFKKFFSPVETETAPQGYGYTINLKTVGNPLMTVMNPCKFGEGFPDFIGRAEGERDIQFYINKINHSIGQSGYQCDVDIVDQYFYSGTGARL